MLKQGLNTPTEVILGIKNYFGAHRSKLKPVMWSACVAILGVQREAHGGGRVLFRPTCLTITGRLASARNQSQSCDHHLAHVKDVTAPTGRPILYTHI